MTALRVVVTGPMTSLQDAGRTGFQRYGVSPSGAMDRLALAAANALVGNGPGAAGIEFMLLGGTLAVEDGEVAIAVMGAPCAVSVDGQGMAPAASVRVRAGAGRGRGGRPKRRSRSSGTRRWSAGPPS